MGVKQSQIMNITQSQTPKTFTNFRINIFYPFNPNLNNIKVFLLVVGDAFSVDYYSHLAERISNKGIIIAVIDFSDERIIKDEGRINTSYNPSCVHVKNMLDSKYGKNKYTITGWFIGGHSSGGKQAYSKACQYNNVIRTIDTQNFNVPSGYIGLDPINRGDGDNYVSLFPYNHLNKPSLIISPIVSGYDIHDDNNGKVFYKFTDSKAPRYLILFSDIDHMFFIQTPTEPTPYMKILFWNFISDIIYYFIMDNSANFHDYISNITNLIYPVMIYSGDKNVT